MIVIDLCGMWYVWNEWVIMIICERLGFDDVSDDFDGWRWFCDLMWDCWCFGIFGVLCFGGCWWGLEFVILVEYDLLLFDLVFFGVGGLEIFSSVWDLRLM